jgi:mRNA interferase MazF
MVRFWDLLREQPGQVTPPWPGGPGAKDPPPAPPAGQSAVQGGRVHLRSARRRLAPGARTRPADHHVWCQRQPETVEASPRPRTGVKQGRWRVREELLRLASGPERRPGRHQRWPTGQGQIVQTRQRAGVCMLGALSPTARMRWLPALAAQARQQPGQPKCCPGQQRDGGRGVPEEPDEVSGRDRGALQQSQPSSVSLKRPGVRGGVRISFGAQLAATFRSSADRDDPVQVRPRVRTCVRPRWMEHDDLPNVQIRWGHGRDGDQRANWQTRGHRPCEDRLKTNVTGECDRYQRQEGGADQPFSPADRGTHLANVLPSVRRAAVTTGEQGALAVADSSGRPVSQYAQRAVTRIDAGERPALSACADGYPIEVHRSSARGHFQNQLSVPERERYEQAKAVQVHPGQLHGGSLTAGWQHAVAVIARAGRARPAAALRAEDLVIDRDGEAPLTAPAADVAGPVPVGSRNGLDHEGAVKCDQIVSIPIERLHEHRGQLLEGQELELHEAIRAAFDVV